MTGKEKCELLKKMRKEIADRNGIEFEPAKCTLENPLCIGTCPRCDVEIQYLDAELNRKAQRGEKIVVAGISPKIMHEEGKCQPLFGKKPVKIPDFMPARIQPDFRDESDERTEAEPWRRGPEGMPDGIYQTMGLIRMPESISSEEGDEYWGEDKEKDEDD